MAKGERKFKQLTKGVNLNKRQATSIRNQINKGIKMPTLKVDGITVNLDQLRTAQDLVARDQAAKRAKTAPTPRLRYNKQGIARTKAGVEISRQEAKLFREQARRINKFSEREQYKATLAYVVEQSKMNTAETRFYPAQARRAPLPYQYVDFSTYKNQAEFRAAQKYQYELYDPKSRTSARAVYLSDIYKNNWAKALVFQVGDAEAKPILELLSNVPSADFKFLMDSGQLDTVGDVYYGVPQEIKTKLEQYKQIFKSAVKENLTYDSLIEIDIDSEDWGLF